MDLGFAEKCLHDAWVSDNRDEKRLKRKSGGRTYETWSEKPKSPRAIERKGDKKLLKQKIQGEKYLEDNGHNRKPKVRVEKSIGGAIASGLENGLTDGVSGIVSGGIGSVGDAITGGGKKKQLKQINQSSQDIDQNTNNIQNMMYSQDMINNMHYNNAAQFAQQQAQAQGRFNQGAAQWMQGNQTPDEERQERLAQANATADPIPGMKTGGRLTKRK
jgi:hypothetical protein